MKRLLLFLSIILCYGLNTQAQDLKFSNIVTTNDSIFTYSVPSYYRTLMRKDTLQYVCKYHIDVFNGSDLVSTISVTQDFPGDSVIQDGFSRSSISRSFKNYRITCSKYPGIVYDSSFYDIDTAYTLRFDIAKQILDTCYTTFIIHPPYPIVFRQTDFSNNTKYSIGFYPTFQTPKPFIGASYSWNLLKDNNKTLACPGFVNSWNEIHVLFENPINIFIGLLNLPKICDYNHFKVSFGRIKNGSFKYDTLNNRFQIVDSNITIVLGNYHNEKGTIELRILRDGENYNQVDSQIVINDTRFNRIDTLKFKKDPHLIDYLNSIRPQDTTICAGFPIRLSRNNGWYFVDSIPAMFPMAKDTLIKQFYSQGYFACSEMGRRNVIVRKAKTFNIPDTNMVVCSHAILNLNSFSKDEDIKYIWKYSSKDLRIDTVDGRLIRNFPKDTLPTSYNSLFKIKHSHIYDLTVYDSTTQCYVFDSVMLNNKSNWKGFYSTRVSIQIQNPKTYVKNYDFYGNILNCESSPITLSAYINDSSFTQKPKNVYYIWDKNVIDGKSFIPSVHTYNVESVSEDGCYSKTSVTFIGYKFEASNNYPNLQTDYVDSSYTGFGVRGSHYKTCSNEKILIQSYILNNYNNVPAYTDSTYRIIKSSLRNVKIGYYNKQAVDTLITPLKGEDQIIVEYTDNKGCRISDTINYKVVEKPELSIIKETKDSIKIINTTSDTKQWIVNGSIYSNDSIGILKTDSTSVYVISTNSDYCSDTSNTIVVKITTDVKETYNSVNKVYPTAVNNSLTYNISNVNNVFLQIIDLTGQIIVYKKIDQISGVISCENLIAGIYIVNVIKNNQVIYTQKILKN